MGQVALGLRSLVIRAFIFFLLASMLAWVLGGSLFPRQPEAHSDVARFLGASWYWRLSPLGPNEALSWQLHRKTDEGRIEVIDAGPWREIAGPVASGGGLYYAGRHVSLNSAEWRIGQLDQTMHLEWFPMPDRLAVEQQLERLRHGLPLQDPATIERDRPLVLEPPHAADDGDDEGAEHRVQG